MSKEKCEYPERLKDNEVGECSPKQIEECHGTTKDHCCCEEE